MLQFRNSTLTVFKSRESEVGEFLPGGRGVNKSSLTLVGLWTVVRVIVELLSQGTIDSRLQFISPRRSASVVIDCAK